MQVKTAKAAILAQSRQPLIVDEIALPDALDVGQVLVKILYTTICGAQINEIEAAKGPDKFLPHLLGHEASGDRDRDRPRRDQRQARRHRGAALAAEPGHPMPAARLQMARREAQRRLGHHVQRLRRRLGEPDDGDPADFDLKVAPLLGCAVTTAAGVINNDAKVKIGESVVVFGVGGVGLNVVQFAQLAGANPIVAVDLLDNKLDMAKTRGATHCAQRGQTVADMDAEIRKIVGAKGPDKVIETTGVKAGHRARLRPHPCGRHLRAGRRAEREGDDLHAADPFQQSADRLARRRARCRMSTFRA